MAHTKNLSAQLVDVTILITIGRGNKVPIEALKKPGSPFVLASRGVPSESSLKAQASYTTPDTSIRFLGSDSGHYIYPITQDSSCYHHDNTNYIASHFRLPEESFVLRKSFDNSYTVVNTILHSCQLLAKKIITP